MSRNWLLFIFEVNDGLIDKVNAAGALTIFHNIDGSPFVDPHQSQMPRICFVILFSQRADFIRVKIKNSPIGESLYNAVDLFGGFFFRTLDLKSREIPRHFGIREHSLRLSINILLAVAA